MMIPRLIGLLLSGLVMAAAPWSPAHAHTSLVTSNPGNGQRVQHAPPRITLRFTEEMVAELATVAVSIDDAAPLTLPVTIGDDPTVLVADTSSVPDEGGAPSAWEVRYRVTSRDGHPIEGRLAFGVAAASPDPPSSPAPSAAASPVNPVDPPVTADSRDPEPAWRSTGAVVGLGVLLVLITGFVAARVLREDR